MPLTIVNKPGKPPSSRKVENPGRGWPSSQGPQNGKGGGLPEIHRTLPHAVEAEQGVLGSMLISPKEAIGEAVVHLKAEDFHVPAHQTIFDLMVEVWDKGGGIDLVTFTNVLRDLGRLEEVGGASFVTSLFTFVPTAANLEYYIDIVRDKSLLRKAIKACTDGVREAFEEQNDVSGVIDRIEQSIMGIGDNRFESTIVPVKDLVMEAIEHIERCYENRDGVTGMSTGFAGLDAMTRGLQNGDMIVIAGRPSMGKTSLAMNIAEHVAIEGNKPVGVFSLEMSRMQLVQRMVCSRARVNMQKVLDGFLSERDFPSLTAAASKLAGAPLFIDDSSALPILELRARARRMKSRFHVELILIDYLQLLRSASKRAQENRQVEISEISSGVKGLAKELGIPIIVCAQLNRQPEARTGGKPRLSDLRESGSIEQDADLVGLLVRPEVYEDDEDERQKLAGEAELIIAKHRNGPIGEVPLVFLKEFTRFEDRAQSVGYALERV